MARRKARASIPPRNKVWRISPGRRLLLVVLLLLPTVTDSLAFPQTPAQELLPGIPDQGIKEGQRILVDGKTNPELVNHDLLIAQIIGLMALPPSSTAKDDRRLQLLSRAVGLGRDDEQVLRAEMIRVGAEIAPVQARLKAARPGSVSVEVPLADLKTSRELRLRSYGRLLELLSEGGRNKLNSYIEKQKRSTKLIVGSPQR